MTRLRLLVLGVGAGLVLGAVPSVAGGDEARARALLESAADAAMTRSWSGTQYVGTWRGAVQTSEVVDVVHRPATGSTVRTTEGGGGVVTPELDPRLLSLLVSQYDLAVAGTGRCAGRAATVVEARRPGRTGAEAVAGRFWLDARSGLVLRREVYAESGKRLRSSAFVEIDVAEQSAAQPARAMPRLRPVASVPEGPWQGPAELPGGMVLFDAQVREHDGGDVLHLAYSDGLSTLSVFAQSGAMPERLRGFHSRQVSGTPAWVQATAPERVVWQGEGQVFTLVSDADPAVVREAVRALPHDAAAREGLRARLARGLSRVGSFLNPFD